MRPASSCAEFHLRSSRRFGHLVTVLHGLAAVLLLTGPFPIWAWLLLPAILLSFGLHWRNRDLAVVLRCDAGRWYLLRDNGETEPLRWLPATRIGPRLTLLHAHSGAGRHFWPVSSDSMPEDQFRRLRALVGISRYG